MIKILVVDDHDLVRKGISRMLSDEKGLEVVGEAETGEDALKMARELQPNVVLMDVKMPGIGGIEATRKIARALPDVKVIAVTACEDEPFPSRLMQAGAMGYLTKGANVKEMVRAIRGVNSGQRFISSGIAQSMALRPFNAEGESPFGQLSEREMQITLMVIGCLKVQEISDKLSLSPKTVNSYRYRIFEKLGLSSDVELTILAAKHGMLDESIAI